MALNRTEFLEGEDSTVVQILGSLGLNRGGLTKSVFQRLKLLGSTRRTIILTLDYQPDALSVLNTLKQERQIPAHTELRSFHSELKQSVNKGRRIDKPYAKWVRDSSVIQVRESRAYSRFFRNGMFLGLIKYREDDIFEFVEVHDEQSPSRRVFRDVYSRENYVAYREFYNEQNKASFRTYYTPKGRPYLSVWVDKYGGEYRHTSLAEGRKTVQNQGDSRISWLTETFKVLGKSIIYTDEPRTLVALRVAPKNVKHVTTVHTTHLSNNRDHSEGLKSWSNSYIAHKQNIDSLVVFTQAQRTDVIRDFKFPEDKVFLAKHMAPNLKPKERVTQDVVMVTRLAPEKRVDHAIEAFSLLSKDLPEPRLLIFGDGYLKPQLQRLIEEKNIEDRVFLKGRTSNAQEAFAGGKCSLVTSTHEGFGLTMLESMSVGTPVVAYDVLYGPKQLVKNDVNGKTVNDGDVVALAEAIKQVLSLDDASLIKESLKTATEYSEKNWEDKWSEIHQNSFMKLV